MKYTYGCHDLSGESQNHWKGKIYEIQITPFSFEIEISAMGSCFHVIMHPYRQGNYLAIPEKNVCFGMGHVSDVFWNWEKMMQLGMGCTDSSSVACALKKLSEKHQI